MQQPVRHADNCGRAAPGSGQASPTTPGPRGRLVQLSSVMCCSLSAGRVLQLGRRPCCRSAAAPCCSGGAGGGQHCYVQVTQPGESAILHHAASCFSKRGWLQSQATGTRHRRASVPQMLPCAPLLHAYHIVCSPRMLHLSNWPQLHMLCCQQVSKVTPWLRQAAALAALLTSGSTQSKFDVLCTAAEVTCAPRPRPSCVWQPSPPRPIISP